jgi:hypothetical protein
VVGGGDVCFEEVEVVVVELFRLLFSEGVDGDVVLFDCLAV